MGRNLILAIMPHVLRKQIRPRPGGARNFGQGDCLADRPVGGASGLAAGDREFAGHEVRARAGWRVHDGQR